MQSKATSKEKNLQILLKNFVESRDDVIIAFIYSNEGLLFSKYSKSDETTHGDKESEDVYGAFSALVENLLDKISLEYKTHRYGSGSFETEDNRIIYLEAGSEAILLLVCDYETNLNSLFPIAYLVAEKIAQLLENSFDFQFNTLDIPDLNIYDTFSLGLDKFSIPESASIINGVTPTHLFKESNNIEKLFKLIVLGSAAVGKTTLVNRFLKKEEIIDYRPTLGISISTLQYHVRGFKDDIIKFLIFDLAGQSFFKRVRRDYYKGANCAFIVYDVTRRETFDEAANFWLKDAQKELGNIPFVLLGNKIDLEEERVVSKEEGLQKAKELKSFFIETSALNNLNVQDTFKIIGIGLFFKHIEESRE
ncbi:MAG: GTP-binding protein [Candidatus Lokiarchaeota archaeon]|nr:GTP-binding protein [Candidatus Lokiarchaeota archaeon]